MSTFRITTNGMFRNYRNNLYKNNTKLQSAMNTVQTERKFTTFAEDPAAASKAWRLRRAYWLNEDQIDNTNHVISKYESASQAMHAIVDGDAGNGIYGLNGILSAIEGISDSAGSSRTALGKELIQTAENMVSVMNSKYGEDFIFAGADGANVPFSWDGDKLLYRGVNVNLEEPPELSYFNLTESDLGGFTQADLEMEMPDVQDFTASDGTVDHDGYNAAVDRYNAVQKFMEAPDPTKYTNGVDDDEYKAAVEKYEKLQSYKEYASGYRARNGVGLAKGTEDYAKLKKMSEETTYVDIGIGMKEQNGELIPDSAFNSSVSGLKFLGFGKDKNLAVIVHELGEIFSRADNDTGEYANAEDKGRVDGLLNRLHIAVQASQDQHVQLEADAKYLNTNLEQLKANKYQMNEQINDTERTDMAEAITEMSWAQYCYNAALRIGTNILSQSLIDYMS